MYDIIVIGSGIGGMTAAGLLAGVAGKKVLVLEKHTEPGGLTHTFRRDGAVWDVGLHYVGKMAPGSQPRALFDYLSAGQLKWNRMPDAFERFIYPGIDFAVPSDPKEFERKLIAAWPDEAAAIKRYFLDIQRVVRWTTLGFARSMVPRPIEPLLRITQRLTNRLATQTTKNYLQTRFHSPQLQTLLASQWGDYGLTPANSAFAIHAQIVHHYLQGAWFPEGGAGRIARSFEPGIERAGGAIRVAQEVTRILIENGRAVGVEVIDRRGAEAKTVIHRAPIIISDAGALITFEKLLPTTGEIGAKTAALRALMQELNTNLSAVTLYLRLKSEVRTIGVHGENYWINTHFDHDDIAAQTHGVLTGNPCSIYVSFPSIKAGDTRFHTAEIIAFIGNGVFDAWRNSSKGNRGADYTTLKHKISDGLLKLADTHIPGLAKLVEYSELSTPLTVEHYTSHSGGRFYGLAASPARYRSSLLSAHTPIKGLYLAGSDAACLGIVGALMGGFGAACQALGASGMPRINAAIKAGYQHSAPTCIPDEKRHAVLIKKQQLTPVIWDVEFEIDKELSMCAPGQFARLLVGNGEWRDYSIVEYKDRSVGFLINTRTGGHGSHFVQNAAIGTKTQIELPLGQYTVSQENYRKIFIATGTGLAPFLPMFRALADEGRLQATSLLFGCRTSSDDITQYFSPLPSTVIRCVSGEVAPEGWFNGYVTEALAGMAFDADATEFYICGIPAMVADCQLLLESRGAKYIFTESF